MTRGATRRGFLAALLFLLLPAAALAQPRAVPIPPPGQQQLSPGGIELFEGLLIVNQLRPVTGKELDGLHRGQGLDDVVMIVFGQATNEQFRATEVASAGGAVLFASDMWIDFGVGYRRAVNQQTGTKNQVVGGRVTAPRAQPDTYYKQNSNPFAVPRPAPRRPGPEWDIFRDLNRVATNTPSYLSIPSPQGEFQSPIAAFPPGCTYMLFRNEQPQIDPEINPFAVAGSGRHPDTRNEYRHLVLADPSVFINEMMLPAQGDEPTDNMEFAQRVVTFLKSRPNAPDRTRFVLFVNGGQIENFTHLRTLLEPPPPPMPELPPLRKNLMKLQEAAVDRADQLADKLQSDDTLHSAFLKGSDSRFRDIAGGLLLLAAIWATWFLLRRVWKSRQPTDVPPPLPAGRSPAAGEPSAVFDRRQRELLRRNNLIEPVRAVIREMFLAAGAPPDAGPKLPPVEVTRAVRRPETLRKTLADLWRIGFGPVKPMTVQQWNVLEPLFLRARRAHADGKWRFTDAMAG